ncbi:hypothetical protein CQA01_34680 [Cyclobacterium qasimii]|nr:hypothetical protein CQA01_34680 [Cyclobacterium qasimii]
MGGDCTNDYFLTQFSGLAGGLESKIVIIPTAMEDNLLDSEFDLNRIKKPFVDHGFKNISIVHTRSREIANGDSLNAILLEADGVWMTGGRQWRLAKTYKDTQVVTSLKTIYNAGKIIAGTSAGASIMGSLLVRGDSVDHTLMIGDYPDGFGLVEHIAIDQHHLARNRQFDMFEIKRRFPELLGIGIEENTGVIVNQDHFKVVGAGYVSIYDGTRWSAERDTIYKLSPDVEQFYLLTANLEYDLQKRKVIFPEDRLEGSINAPLPLTLEGTYQQAEGLEIGNDIQIKVTIEGGKCYFEQSWNGTSYEVKYDHALTFFRPNTNAVFYFEKDKFGSIDRFNYYQHGSTTWRKLDES